MPIGLWLALTGSGVAHAVDVASWQAVLDAHVDTASDVDYAGVKADPRLETYVAGLATASEPEGKEAQLAFWMNAYNALTVDLVTDEWPLASIRDLDGGNPWRKRTFTVAGRSVTLDDIEHRILRPLGDPRIHAGVNCASRGARRFTARRSRPNVENWMQPWGAGRERPVSMWTRGAGRSRQQDLRLVRRRP